MALRGVSWRNTTSEKSGWRRSTVGLPKPRETRTKTKKSSNKSVFPIPGCFSIVAKAKQTEKIHTINNCFCVVGWGGLINFGFIYVRCICFLVFVCYGFLLLAFPHFITSLNPELNDPSPLTAPRWKLMAGLQDPLSLFGRRDETWPSKQYFTTQTQGANQTKKSNTAMEQQLWPQLLNLLCVVLTFFRIPFTSRNQTKEGQRKQTNQQTNKQTNHRTNKQNKQTNQIEPNQSKHTTQTNYWFEMFLCCSSCFVCSFLVF